MRLLVVSHKEAWFNDGGCVTVGGFPRQMAALSELFDESVLMATVRRGRPPSGVQPLVGNCLSIEMLPEPRGSGLGRKLLLPLWLARNLRSIWIQMSRADAVHALVPGDVGSIGLALAWLRGKRLFIRHCGTWGHRATLADRLLDWALPRLASRGAVVVATGGGDRPPSAESPSIDWIFATSMTKRELAELPFACRWRPGGPLRLVTVSRLTLGKNTAAILEALPSLLERLPETSLDIVGGGPEGRRLIALARRLGLGSQVRFHGNLSHDRVLEVLCQSSLFVFPTRVAEGFPKALVEAMACSLPVIATAVSVVPTLLATGAGLVLDDPTPASLSAACVAATADGGGYEKMAKKAHSVAAELSLERWRDTLGRRLSQEWGALRRGTEPGRGACP